MSIFNSLEFDGVNSLDNDVYITGESVYDAPERDVEVVEIAGRNGNFLLDKGRWKNIEVTYHCGTFGLDQTEFGTKMRAFRNKLASKIGYMRLTDTYHPDEFRMGAFKSALEVDPVSYKRAGEFEVNFDCKPQRWLTDGEQEIEVSDGDVLLNPTPYDASPLLMVEGYGTIGFNGYEVEVADGSIGTINVSDRRHGKIVNIVLNNIALPYKSGDQFVISFDNVGVSLHSSHIGFSTQTRSTFVTEAGSGYPSVLPNQPSFARDAVDWGMYATIPDIVVTAGEIIPSTIVGSIISTIPLSTNGGEVDLTVRTDIRLIKSQTILTVAVETIMSSSIDISTITESSWIVVQSVKINSTETRLGHPTYIDCDLGDAYMIKDGSYISLNSYIDLGSDLPVLASGNNELTVDNTITELKIVPRWWIL